MSEEIEVVTNLSGATVDSSRVTCLTETLIENLSYICRYSGPVRITPQPDTYIDTFKMLLPVPPSISGSVKISNSRFIGFESGNNQRRYWLVQYDADGGALSYDVQIDNGQTYMDSMGGVRGRLIRCGGSGYCDQIVVYLDDVALMYNV